MTITVYYDSMPLHVYQSVAQRLGLQADQHLATHREFCEVLTQNATHYALLRLAQSDN